MFSRLEETRAQLEATLGLASLLHAYHLIQVGVPWGRKEYIIVFHLCVSPQAFHEEEGEQFPLTSLTSVVGEGNAHHCPALIHLVLADSAYFENNSVKGQWVIDGGIITQEVVYVGCTHLPSLHTHTHTHTHTECTHGKGTVEMCC